jgi:hypothetical protein
VKYESTVHHFWNESGSMRHWQPFLSRGALNVSIKLALPSIFIAQKHKKLQKTSS